MDLTKINVEDWGKGKLAKGIGMRLVALKTWATCIEHSFQNDPALQASLTFNAIETF